MAKTQRTPEDFLIEASEFFKNNQIDKAKELLLKAIKIHPKSGEFYYNLAIIFAQEGFYDKAIELYQKTICLSPKFENAYLNLGVISIKNNLINQGIKAFNNLLKINAHNWAAYYNLGLAMQKKGEYNQAYKMFTEAIKIDGNNAETFFQLGLLTLNTGKVPASVQYFQKALDVKPDLTMAMGGLGEAYEKMGNFEKARETFQKALKMDSNILPDVSVSLYYLSKRTCNWENSNQEIENLNQLTQSQLNQKGNIDESPFINISRSDNLDFNLRVAQKWSEAIVNSIKFSNQNFVHSRKKNNRKKIKIGYLSNDFRDHPIASQIFELFKYHDRNKFEIFSYSYGPNDKSYWRKQIEKYSENFIDLYDTDHQEIAKRIYQDKIDILVDLVGYTGFQRPDIMAHRPAPIQINYLGYPGTTGASFIDFVIGDKIIIPPSDQKYYSEKVLYVPHCYQICSPPSVSSKKFKRSDFHIPQKAFVFGSFNRPEKIEKEIFDCWIKILKEFPNSILWLYPGNNTAQNNLKNYFQKSGLNPKRLIFVKRIPFKEYLSSLKLVDLALDTHIYSGGATTANLLWMEVPLITIMGGHYLSKMSSSILTNIGLTELITNNLDDYQKLAITLAQDSQKLKILKNKIKTNKKIFPLFNSFLFTQNLEKIYQQIWEDYLCKIKK